MWNKKIVITQHAIQRFEQRNITFSKYENNPARQILCDLKPMNVIKREHLYYNHYKVTTKQGKVYIIIEYANACFVKTVYKTSDQFDAFKYLEYNKNRRKKNERNKLEKSKR